jgi:hypothetical protein
MANPHIDFEFPIVRMSFPNLMRPKCIKHRWRLVTRGENGNQLYKCVNCTSFIIKGVRP